MQKLSVIILSFNTRELLADCLDSLNQRKNEVEFETIVVDNASSDGSSEFVKNNYAWVKLLVNSENLGFAKGNNTAKLFSKGEYVLFLNSDTILHKNALKETLAYMLENKDVGALTCKIVLPGGGLDLDARRSFITPWVGLTHLFFRLDRIFPKSKIFSRYWYGYKSPDETHEVDVIQGAFFLVRKKILDDVGWFDEDYFLDGEDVDLCWKIKEKGWKIVYYPKVSITHVKGASKGKNKTLKKKVSFQERLRYKMAGVDSMEIFLKKRLWKQYPLALNFITLVGIKLVKFSRFVSLLIFR